MKTKFFTGQGDKGQSAFGKKKLPKDNALFDLLGDLDELNSWIGFARVEAKKDMGEILKMVQQDLFVIQAEAAVTGFGYEARGFSKIDAGRTRNIERIIEALDKKLPPIRKFILPGGSELSARLDIARVIARRAERAAVRFNRTKKLSPELLQFLNRLSSLFFALARYANRKKGVKEENPKY
ncbi:MAG: cob(I)yrinic acid a,c-diamide adenosyltransferase [Minisyncoccia bacterium]